MASVNKLGGGWFGFSVLLGALALVSGCSGADTSGEGAGSVQADGLAITAADTATGRFAGTFVHQGRLIRFEAVRGEPNETTDPDAPRFAVDARFLDAAGSTFILSGGGGEIARADWAPSTNPNPDERAKDLSLLPLLADELSAAGAPSGLEYEFQKISQLAGELRGKELIVKAEGDVQYGCSTGYEHDMTIRYKAAFDLPVGHHTAVRLNSWYLNSSCTWVYQGYQESCNHGTCATSATMSDWCTWSSPLRSTTWPAFQVYSSQGYGACSTFYNPFSNLGGHNCNDDTYFQGYNIRNNAFYLAASGPSGVCSDSTGHTYAPSCTGARGAP